MSFLDSSISAAQPNQSNPMNFGSFPANFGEVIENNIEASFDSNKIEKCPKSVSSGNHDPRHMSMCLEYDKCFGHTFEFSANNFDYGIDHSFGLNTIASQSYNNANQIGYNLNYGETQELPKQIGKSIFLTALGFLYRNTNIESLNSFHN